DEWLGSRERHVAAETGRDDRDVAGHDLERLVADRGPNLAQQAFTLRLGDGAADHNPVWVEGVHVADAADRHRPPGAGHELGAGGIAGMLAGRDVDRGQLVQPDLAGAPLEVWRSPGFDCRLRELG